VDDRERQGASRRNFLKAMGSAVGAAALPLQSDFASAATEPNHYDVVVIGGGFAGVTAARELRHAGMRTLVLEARNRLGGRTFTAHLDDELYELGGTWIHSTQPHVFAEATRYGLELVEHINGMPERVLWWDGKRAREGGVREVPALIKEAVCAAGEEELDVEFAALAGLALMSSQMGEFHAGATTAFPLPFDPFSGDAWKSADEISIRDRLDQLDIPEDRRGPLEGMLGASAHGSFSEASFAEMLRWWALSGNDLQRYTDSVARYRFRDGTASLIDAMLEDGRPDLRLGTPVAEVTESGDEVRIRTVGGETFTARAVIAALPQNVLSRIHFTPALHPDKVAASEQRHAGAGIKVYVKVRGELPPMVLFANESEPFSAVFTLETEGEDTVFVAFGTAPGRIDVHDKSAVQKFLRRFLPEVEVVNTFAYDWHLDPYSLGTWCVLRKGQLTHSLSALREPHGRVHFAGGDFALGWRGFIDGAIESGYHAAGAVISQLDGRREARAAAAVAPAAGRAAAATPSDPAFQQCAVCHPADPSLKPGIGPNLHGVVGRPVGGTADFAYSEALARREHAWTEAELDAFLLDPAAYAPGTAMPFGGLKDPEQRAAVIRYLREME